jgi:putative transcriptional regulator
VIKVQLKEAVKESGHTLYWLAKKSGVSYNTLWRLKKGSAKSINFDTLEKICGALKCKPGDILTLSRSITKSRKS